MCMYKYTQCHELSLTCIYSFSQRISINQEIHKLPLERVGGAVAGDSGDVQEDVLLQD